MANPWPESLPCRALVDGLSVEVGDGVVSFQPDGGPVMTRRRFSYSPNTVQLRWKMSREQVQTFEAFYRDDLDMGALPFTYTDEVANAAADFKFVPGQPPRWVRATMNAYFVSATLQKL